MWFSVSEHLIVTFYSFIVGIVFGVIYDTIKLSRCLLGVGNFSFASRFFQKVKIPFIKPVTRSRPSKIKGIYSDITVFIGDIIFSLICAAIYSLFLFHAIRGQVRLYFIIASAAGFFLYYFTLSRFVMVLFEFIILFLRTVASCLFRIIFHPFHLLFRLLVRCARHLYNCFTVPLIKKLKYKSAIRYTKLHSDKLISKIRF